VLLVRLNSLSIAKQVYLQYALIPVKKTTKNDLIEVKRDIKEILAILGTSHLFDKRLEIYPLGLQKH
jgi:hypothetical protein